MNPGKDWCEMSIIVADGKLEPKQSEKVNTFLFYNGKNEMLTQDSFTTKICLRKHRVHWICDKRICTRKARTLQC